MKRVWALLGVLLCASIAQAQPDNGPGMAVIKPPTVPQPQPAPPKTAAERRAANRAVYNRFNHPAGKLDLSTPEATVRSCIWALLNADFKTARECIQDVQPYEKLVAIEEETRKFESAKDYEDNWLITDLHSYLTDSSMISPYMPGETAVVTLRAVLIAGTPDSDFLSGSNERFYLNRVGDKWLIINTQKPSNPFYPELTPMLMDDILGKFVSVLVYPDIVTQHEQALLCHENLVHIGRAIFSFANDFNEKFPPSKEWREQLLPYIREDEKGTEKVFRCPNVEEVKSSYRYNTELENKTLGNIVAPAQTIFLYEGKDRKFEFRHQAGEDKITNILFADGHVKIFTEKALEAALKDESVRWTP